MNRETSEELGAVAKIGCTVLLFAGIPAVVLVATVYAIVWIVRYV